MRETIYHCDVCHRPKGETNHWWLAQIHDSHGREISIEDWTETDARQDGVIHLCGQECVQKKVSEFLGQKII